MAREAEGGRNGTALVEGGVEVRSAVEECLAVTSVRWRTDRASRPVQVVVGTGAGSTGARTERPRDAFARTRRVARLVSGFVDGAARATGQECSTRWDGAGRNETRIRPLCTRRHAVHFGAPDASSGPTMVTGRGTDGFVRSGACQLLRSRN